MNPAIPTLIGLCMVQAGRWAARKVQILRPVPKPSRHQIAERLRELDLAKRVCESCRTEAPEDAVFCSQCGSSHITTHRALVERAQAEAQKLERERDERQRREREQREEADRSKETVKQQQLRVEAAGKRCREVASRCYCQACRAERKATDKFCVKCGGRTQKIPIEAAFQIVRREFPDVVGSVNDFNRFVG